MEGTKYGLQCGLGFRAGRGVQGLGYSFRRQGYMGIQRTVIRFWV